MSEKWYANRTSIAARSDEDRAMGFVQTGPYASEGDAHAGLAEMIEKEIAAWRSMNMDPSRDERALARVVGDGETDVTEGNIRWTIVNVTPRPMVNKWQCDLHAVSVAAMCCGLARELGAYEPTERVRCARCEEYVIEPKHEDGREFGRSSSNGVICMPCVVETEFDGGARLTLTATKLLSYLISPTKEASHAARRANRLTREKLVATGFAVETNTYPYHAATLMARKYVELYVRELPTVPYAVEAAILVRSAIEAPIGRHSAAEELAAHRLADAIERRDRAAESYHRSTLDMIAQIKRIVVESGGSWN